MQLTSPVGAPYAYTLAEPDLYESAETTSVLPVLTELEVLIEQEFKEDGSDTPWPGLPISQDRMAHEAELLQQCELSGELASWVEDFEKVGHGHRKPYLWKWCRHGSEVTMLPCVSAAWRDEVCDTKLLGIMLDVLVDDVADQGGDPEFLERLIGLPLAGRSSDWRGFSGEHQRYAAFTEDVWNEIQRRVEHFPRYDEFADLLRYDYLQLLNMMRYAHLTNRFPSLLNLAEHDAYMPNNMHIMINATMDLMCSPEFKFAELGRLRQAVFHAERMGRIGDMITTWERELYQSDFTSGVFARAVVCGDLSPEQLDRGDHNLIGHAIRDGRHEEYFLRQWQTHRQEILKQKDSVRSVDLGTVVENLDRLICLHLVSRGHK